MGHSEAEVSKVIETGVLKAWLSQAGFLYFKCFPEKKHTLKDAKETMRVSALLLGGRKRPALVDLRPIKFITREAREYYSGENMTTLVCAAALIVGSPLSRMVGNFFLGMNKPLIPIRLFSEERKAIQWLKKFI